LIGDAGAAASVLSIILESVSLNVPVKLKEDSNISAIYC
jgi:formiminotetrahydrofolate cyclodeaminase